MDTCLSKIKLFINNIGPCKMIQEDNGREFVNREMKILCENSHIKFIKSSPYHLQEKGPIEIKYRLCCNYLLEICQDENLIKQVINNIIKAYCRKVEKK